MWWEKVRELIEYARTEKPDAYEILRMANEITEQRNASMPPAASDPEIPLYIQHS